MKKILVALFILFFKTTGSEINFFAPAPEFYGKSNSVLAQSEPITLYNRLIDEARVSPRDAANAYKKLRAIRSIRYGIGDKYTGSNFLARREGGLFGGFLGFGAPEDYTESALTIIAKKLKESGNVTEEIDPLEKIRTDLINTVKPTFDEQDNALLNTLVELETLWGTPEENDKNKDALLALAEKINARKTIEDLLAPETKPAEEILEPEATPVESSSVEAVAPISKAKETEKTDVAEQHVRKKPLPPIPSKPAKIEPEKPAKKPEAPAAEPSAEAVTPISEAKETEKAPETAAETVVQTKRTPTQKDLAHEAKEVMVGNKPTPIANLTSLLEKIGFALQKLANISQI
jgi:hypothetical protein